MKNSGITCKVWNIKGETATRSTSTQLGDSIGYVLNNEKTECKLGLETSPISDPLGQIGRECKYIQNDIKTLSGALVGSKNLFSTNVADSVAEMMEIKEFYQKKGGRAALHGVISLCENESEVKNASALMSLCEKVLEEVFPNNQAIFAVHTNTDNLHIHFLINSVGLDGKKIHQDDQFIKKVLHPCVNKYARVYGFTPNEKWEIEKEELKKSFTELKISLRKSIDIVIEKSNNFDEFIELLEKDGYTVNVGKYISIKSEDMGKAIRTHNLGTSYSRDSIVERILNRRNAFEKITINDYVMAEQVDAVFTPQIVQMKRYAEMDQEQKQYVISQLRLGNNPWREHQKRNWQLNQVANELNIQNRVASYVSNYSMDGTLQGALDGIIEAKKKISKEKRIISVQKKKYKPILDIYEEMKGIEKKAYLYERENIPEYRTEFEHYRLLTRRLKDGYDKDVFEVAHFLSECEERLIYAQAQLNELSEEYREIKKYALQNGTRLEQNGTLTDIVGFYDAKKDERQGIYDADVFYVAAANSSDFLIRVIKTPTVDEDGRIIEKYELVVMNKYGEIVEELEGKGNNNSFLEQLEKLEQKYELSDCRRFSNASLAREYIENKEQNNVTQPIKILDINQQPISFTQALNHNSYHNKSFMIVDAKMPTYVAIINTEGEKLKVTVFDKKNKIQESVLVPLVFSETKEGYRQIVDIQKKYGFSDSVLTFKSISEAHSYMDSAVVKKEQIEQKVRNIRNI